MPAPTTTTSAATSRSSGGRGDESLPSNHSERSTVRGYPVLPGPTPGQETTVVGCRALVAVVLTALAVAGCGTGGRERDAAAVAERFHAALERGDAQTACDQLSEETASKLEQQEGKPCEKAILTLKLPKGGTAAVRRVEITSAYVGLAEGSADFLDEGPEGWRISAAGCEPTASDQPYECEVEG
jgi:hypothetical protein